MQPAALQKHAAPHCSSRLHALDFVIPPSGHLCCCRTCAAVPGGFLRIFHLAVVVVVADKGCCLHGGCPWSTQLTVNTVEVSSGNFMTAHVILSKHLEGKNSLFRFCFFLGGFSLGFFCKTFSFLFYLKSSFCRKKSA